MAGTKSASWLKKLEEQREPPFPFPHGRQIE